MKWTITAAVVLCTAFAASAAVTNDVVGAPDGDIPIDATADKMEYGADGKVLRATGNVIVRRGTEELRADRVTVKTDSLEVWATGRVIVRQKGSEWTGDRFYCDMDAGTVYGEGRSVFSALPFRGSTDGCSKVGKSLSGKNALVTTCAMKQEDWHYHARASRVTIIPGEGMVARNVVFFFAGIPFLYVPYWEKTEEGYGLSLQPGYSSRMGAYLLASYGYGLGDWLDGTTHLDYRTKRGWAAGQDLEWRDEKNSRSGGATVYYADDQAPLDETDADDGSIGSSRYRLRFYHSEALSSRTYLLSRFHYLSDRDVLDDFFRSEYRIEPQPDNYVSVRYRGESFTAGITVRPRLNDFYEAVARMPEVSIEFPMEKLGSLPFYYERQGSIAYIEKLWPAGDTNESYSAVRADSRHMISMNEKLAFLNIIPRLGYRGTYYSDSTGAAPGEASGGSAYRSVFETGARVSFKAYKTLRQAGEGLRHVIEPYVDYTYVPEPDMSAVELYQFDSVDDIDAQNKVRIGMRNKLQVKRNSAPYDLADIDIWADGNLNSEEGQNTFDQLEVDAEFRPLGHVSVDCDGKFGLSGTVMREFNTHLIVGEREVTYADIEYRLRKDESSLLAAKLAYSPSARWTYSYYARYEFEDSRLEEHNFWVRRNLDCMCIALGFSQIPGYTRSDGTAAGDEYQILFKMWLTAFPNAGISLE